MKKRERIKCTLILTGSKKAVAAFVDAARGYDRVYVKNEAEKRALVRLYQNQPLPATFQEFCFHALVPVPENILKSGLECVGYDWEVSRWGALNVRVQHCPMPKGAKVVYRFWTLGSLPLPLLDAVAKDYPKLRLVLMGVTMWKKGRRYE